MAQQNKNKSQYEDNCGDASPTRSAHKSLLLDVDLYERYLDDSGMTEDQRQKYLEALWSIIVSFVDLGWGVHPLQQVCGQASKPLDIGAILSPNEVKSGDSQKHNKNSIARQYAVAAREKI